MIRVDMEKTGDNIKRLRQMKSIKVEEVAVQCGFQNPQSVYKWERGATLPSIDSLVILSRILDTKIDDILVCDD